MSDDLRKLAEAAIYNKTGVLVPPQKLLDLLDKADRLEAELAKLRPAGWTSVGRHARPEPPSALERAHKLEGWLDGLTERVRAAEADADRLRRNIRHDPGCRYHPLLVGENPVNPCECEAQIAATFYDARREAVAARTKEAGE